MPIRYLHLRPHHRPRTAFVLGGGGNLGAVQVGMLRALLERHIRPDVLIGCSVGALNAAAYLTHVREATARYREIGRRLAGGREPAQVLLLHATELAADHEPGISIHPTCQLKHSFIISFNKR